MRRILCVLIVFVCCGGSLEARGLGDLLGGILRNELQKRTDRQPAPAAVYRPPPQVRTFNPYLVNQVQQAPQVRSRSVTDRTKAPPVRKSRKSEPEPRREESSDEPSEDGHECVTGGAHPAAFSLAPASSLLDDRAARVHAVRP